MRRWLTGTGITCAVLFAAILLWVLARHGAPVGPDEAVHQSAIDVRTPWLDSMAVALHWIGNYYLILVYGFALAVFVRERRAAAGIFLSVAGFAPIVELVKLTVARPRPDPTKWLVEDAGASFVSGHAGGMMVLCLTALMLLDRVRNIAAREAMRGVLVVLPFGMGLDRIYVGVHYASDVVGGWLLAAAWFCVSWRLVLWKSVANGRDLQRPGS